MSKKLLFIDVGFILASFAFGWEAALMANKHGELNAPAQAIPIIRFERFDETRNTLILGLVNPGKSPIEISRTELSYQVNDTLPSAEFDIKEYGNKPLVLDPGDTILVPLAKTQALKPRSEAGRYWGQLDFRIPGQIDFYSIHHRLSADQVDDFNNAKPLTETR